MSKEIKWMFLSNLWDFDLIYSNENCYNFLSATDCQCHQQIQIDALTRVFFVHHKIYDSYWKVIFVLDNKMLPNEFGIPTMFGGENIFQTNLLVCGQSRTFHIYFKMCNLIEWDKQMKIGELFFMFFFLCCFLFLCSIGCEKNTHAEREKDWLESNDFPNAWPAYIHTHTHTK